MPTGKSLHIGVLNPSKCRDLPAIKSPENDAQEMERIAKSMEFDTTLRIQGTGTWAQVIIDIEEARKTLLDGDIFLITFSGHGTELQDRRIQTWCMDDEMITDRQLLAELAKFPPKVRVLVVSASCHSGGLSAGPIDRLVLAIRKAFRALSKVMEGGVGLSADECKLDPKPHEIPTEFVNPPAMLFLTSCRSNEKSKDGRNLSLFTEKLRDVWNGGTFKGNYRDFINQVSAAVSDANDQQHPTCAWAGTFPGWHEHQPFRIMPPGP